MRPATAVALLLSLATLGGRASDAWKPSADMGDELFPAFIVATATVSPPKDKDHKPDPLFLGEEDGLLGITIKSPKAGAKVKVVVKANALLDASEVEVTLPKAATTYEVFPKINWKYDALVRVKQTAPVNIVFDVTVDGASAGNKTKTMRVRPVNDCPYYVDRGEGQAGEDLGWMFAAYVNEDHPWIDQLLKEALATKIVESFDGYQSNDPQQVYLQVFAIWHVLQKRGFKYSDVTTTAAGSETVQSQHVRFLDDSVKGGMANCVDGTVLFASILRKISIEPHLVLVPGHMYLAFDLDAEGKTSSGLETTMMGQDDLKDFDKVKGIADDMRAEHKQDASWQTFEAAIDAGTDDLNKNARKFEAGKESDYQLISIAVARKIGIMPISFSSTTSTPDK